MKKLLSVLLGAGLLLTNVAEAKSVSVARVSVSRPASSGGFKVYSAKPATSASPKVGVSVTPKSSVTRSTALMPVPSAVKPKPVIPTPTPIAKSTKADATFRHTPSRAVTPPPVVVHRTEYRERERDRGYGDMLAGAAGGYLLAKALEPTPAVAQPQQAPTPTVAPVAEQATPKPSAEVAQTTVMQPPVVAMQTVQSYSEQPQTVQAVENMQNVAHTPTSVAVVPEFKGGVDNENFKIFRGRLGEMYCLNNVIYLKETGTGIPMQPMIGRNGLPAPCQLKP